MIMSKMNHLANQVLSYVFIAWITAGTHQAVLGKPNITLTQTSSVDITSGQEVCPSTHAEFMCVGVNINFLEWQINGAELQPNFDIGDSAPIEVTSGSYTLYLDTISVDTVDRVANMTIRFQANISNLNNGDRLSCATQFGSAIIKSSIFDYTIRDPPPTPLSTKTTLVDTNEMLLAFNLTWDSNFNSEHAITSYTISVPENTEGRSVIFCPRSCYPDDSCQCRGLMRGDNVTILVSAVNCGNQEGMPKRVPVASTCPENELGSINDSTMSCNTSPSFLNTGGSLAIANGIVCFSSTTIGSVATYRCDDGYSIVGDSQRFCQSNGTWTDNIPKCARHQNLSNNIIIVIVVASAFIATLTVVLIIVITCAYQFKRRRSKDIANPMSTDDEDKADIHRPLNQQLSHRSSYTPLKRKEKHYYEFDDFTEDKDYRQAECNSLVSSI